jgi:arsenate reductase
MSNASESVTLYHNPACKHSRGALDLLKSRGIQFDTIEYLKTPPKRADLERIIEMIEVPAAELVRKDKRFDELKLRADDYASKDAVVGLLLEHPELMQRPVVIRRGRAVIARPPEKLESLL